MSVDSRSRAEDILHVSLGDLDPSVLQPPQSRIEVLLQRLYDKIGDIDGKIKIHICTSDEYDHESGMPTVEDPEENVFYLVPTGTETDDMYDEWIFTVGNRWEKFGSGGGGSVEITQSDWNQNDSTANDYIKNKPNLTLKLDKNQGAVNSGKFMWVNNAGNVVPVEIEGGSISVIEELISGEDYEITIEEGEGTGGVSDVQVNGVSVVSGGVANVQVGNGLRLANNASHAIIISEPSTGDIRTRSSTKVITPVVQDMSVFYGLAWVAGDTTQATVAGNIGNYTESAKSAISEMLGGSIAVTGTTPSITALPGVRYVCGEVSTIDVTVPATGIVDVVFTSGATPAVLTVTPPTGVTMKWANGFDPTTLDADTVYEINVMDGSLGVAGTWT